MQQQYVAENTTVAADVLSRICHGLAAAAPAIGGVLLYLVRINEQWQVITAPYRHVQDSSGDRYSNSDPEVAATGGVAVLQW